jgi:hypothetical protein
MNKLRKAITPWLPAIVSSACSVLILHYFIAVPIENGEELSRLMCRIFVGCAFIGLANLIGFVIQLGLALVSIIRASGSR